MDARQQFLEGFSDEIEKQAFAPLLGAAARILPFLARAGAGVKAFAGKAVQHAAAHPATQAAGRWLGAHPRTSKALNFTGSTLLTGAAGEVGMMPFQPRKKVVEVAPEAMRENMLLRQYRVRV
jgi:hypothetical protein